MHHRQLRARSYVVPMHRYINYASLKFDVLDVMNERGDSLRDFHTAQRNSSEDNLFELWISLSDFVRNPSKHATNFLRVHYQDSGWRILFWLVHAFPWRPLWIALKEKKLGGGRFGARLLPSPFSPVGAMFHDPLKQSSFKANVFTGFLALNPFVLQNL